MEDMLLSFFLEHGWKLTLIALSGIPFLGILKRAHVFDKIQSKNARKALFEGISSVFAILMSLIYLFAVKRFNCEAFAILAGGILIVNQAAYSIYENFGLRGLINKGIDFLWRVIKGMFIKKDVDDSEDDIDLIDDLPKNDKK